MTLPAAGPGWAGARVIVAQWATSAHAVGAAVFQRARTWPRPALAWLRESPWPMPASIVLHVALVVAIALRVQGAGDGAPTPIEPPSVEIELVNQQDLQRGTPTGADSGEAASAATGGSPLPSGDPTPAMPDSAPAIPAPPPVAVASTDGTAAPERPQPAAPQPDSPPAAAPVPRPAIGALGVPMPTRYVPAANTADATAQTDGAADRGNADRDQAAMSVQGINFVPPQPDAQHRNRPPAYPPDAARKRITGTVELVVRVTPQGTAGTIRISRSSGVPSLDRSAADAIRGWHFTPALRDGTAIAFDYPISIRFTLGNS